MGDSNRPAHLPGQAQHLRGRVLQGPQSVALLLLRHLRFLRGRQVRASRKDVLPRSKLGRVEGLHGRVQFECRLHTSPKKKKTRAGWLSAKRSYTLLTWKYENAKLNLFWLSWEHRKMEQPRSLSPPTGLACALQHFWWSMCTKIGFKRFSSVLHVRWRVRASMPLLLHFNLPWICSNCFKRGREQSPVLPVHQTCPHISEKMCARSQVPGKDKSLW